MKVASDHLNSLVHKHIAQTTSVIRDKCYSAVLECTVTSMMEHVDSTLWELINNLTQTVWARRGAVPTAEISLDTLKILSYNICNFLLHGYSEDIT